MYSNLKFPSFYVLMLTTIFFLGSFLVTNIPKAQAQSAPGMYYGAYTENLSDLSSFEADAGKKVSLFMIFQSWNEGNFPQGTLDSIRTHGSIPVVSWDSYIPERPEDTSWQGISEGKMDSYITQYANDAKKWGHPFFLRFDWEMNGFWNPYAKQRDSFVPMWKHVHDIFTSVGANNVTWVWCPNIDSNSTQPLEPMYPGAGYVDWVCIDGYNFGNTQSWSSWVTFTPLFAPTYNHLLRLAPGKPIMLAELASTEQGGSKAAWIQDMLTLFPTSYPNIKAFIWFNLNKETDWRIESSEASKQSFAQGIASPYYASNQYGNLSNSPIPYLGNLTAVTVAPKPTFIPTRRPTATPIPTLVLVSATPAAIPLANIGPQRYLDYINNQIKLELFAALLILILVGFLLFRNKLFKSKKKPHS